MPKKIAKQTRPTRIIVRTLILAGGASVCGEEKYAA